MRDFLFTSSDTWPVVSVFSHKMQQMSAVGDQQAQWSDKMVTKIKS